MSTNPPVPPAVPKPRERAVLFVNGRLDRMIEKSGELCAGAALAPFPELEKMTR